MQTILPVSVNFLEFVYFPVIEKALVKKAVVADVLLTFIKLKTRKTFELWTGIEPTTF